MAKADIKLTKESEALLKKLSESGNIDFRPTFKVIGMGYRQEVKGIFGHMQPRQPYKRWPALSEKYAEWKQKHYPGQPLMVRTGALKQSMTEQGAKGNITVISKMHAIFGSSIDYGIYHDSNEPRKSRLPQRNFSEPSERREKIWLDQIEKDIRRNFELNGIEVKGAIFQ